jgi:Flp pilus assembly protein TadG
MIRKFFTLIKSEVGSATVEFVGLAIPLFIPVFIYLNHFSAVSANEEIARSMAREILRVYVISENDLAARDLSGKATQMLARQWHLTANSNGVLTFSLPHGKWTNQVNYFIY